MPAKSSFLIFRHAFFSELLRLHILNLSLYFLSFWKSILWDRGPNTSKCIWDMWYFPEDSELNLLIYYNITRK